MASTVYRSAVAITSRSLRRAAFERAQWLFAHLDDLDLNLVKLERVVGSFLEVTLDNPLPVAQVAHLGLTGPVTATAAAATTGTLYRSAIAITNRAQRRLVYERAQWLFVHLDDLDVDVVKLERVGTLIEVLVATPLPVAQVAHLGLTGPV